ncbi:MAG: 2-oxoacid:acceptor oxidoreductase family protein [bacterium]|nr:2-oxoacid:acceptor oxidoreductase family protein [bacterium]
MYLEVKFAGFGGQGIMLAGKLLAEAAMMEGKQVVWIPSYGPEMRGGTAYCTVVIATKPIGSPIINNPANIVVMNRPSLEKFAPMMKPNGICLVNSSLIPITSGRNDIIEIRLPCNDVAIALNNPKAANMVALGGFVGLTQCVSIQSVEIAVKNEFHTKAKFIEPNIAAIRKGAELAVTDEVRVKYEGVKV